MRAELHFVVSDPPSERKWLLANCAPLPGCIQPQFHWFKRKHLALQYAARRGISVRVLPLKQITQAKEQPHA